MLQYPSSVDLLFRIKLYGSVIHDLRVRWAGLCSLFQIHPPENHKRLIQSYAVGSRTDGNLKAIWIAIAVPSNLVDIEVLRVGIVREVRLSSSVENRIFD